MITCKICQRIPNEIKEYIELAQKCKMTPEQYVIEREKTFNLKTESFLCHECNGYIIDTIAGRWDNRHRDDVTFLNPVPKIPHDPWHLGISLPSRIPLLLRQKLNGESA